jgi:predicted nucleotidyltransferase
MTRERIIQILQEHKTALQQKYPIGKLALFGSCARNEQTAFSDIDVMVELKEPMGWDFIDLLEDLEKLFPNRKIDLISKNGISPQRWGYFSKDLIYV